MRTASRVAITALCLCAAWLRGICAETDGKQLGDALGRSFIVSAEALAAAGIRGFVECEPPFDTQEMEQQCGNFQQTMDILLEIQDGIEKGTIGKERKYEDTYDYAMFAALKDGLRSSKPLVRWHVLGRVFGTCDEPSALSALGKKECRKEVEAACLETLKTDTDPMNRQFALEVLGLGYAGTASKPVLGQIAAVPSKKKTECPLIFDPEKADDNAFLTQLEEGHAKNPFSCEARLAADALRKLKSGKTPKRGGE